MKIMNHGPSVQQTFPSGISGTNSIILGLETIVAVDALDTMEAYVGDTDPPIRVRLERGAEIGLDNVSWTYACELRNLDAGTVVRDDAATYSTTTGGDPVLTLALLSSDFSVAGSYQYQFRAIETATAKVMYFTALRLYVRDVV